MRFAFTRAKATIPGDLETLSRPSVPALTVAFDCSVGLKDPLNHCQHITPNTAVVQSLNEQIFLVPCLLQRARAVAMLLQPSAEPAAVLLSCFVHFPLVVVAVVMHASVVQYP